MSDFLCDPIDGSPPDSPIPRILQARTLEWVAISFSNAWKWKVKVKSLSHVQLLVTPWTAAHQASPSMGFSRQEYWSGAPLPSPTASTNSPYFSELSFSPPYLITSHEELMTTFIPNPKIASSTINHPVFLRLFFPISTHVLFFLIWGTAEVSVFGHALTAPYCLHSCRGLPLIDFSPV